MERYWVYLDSRVQGPIEVPALRKLPGFNLLAQVCPEHGKTWRIADDVIEIKSYFLSPPRLSALPDLAVLPTAPPVILPDAEPQERSAPLSILEELPPPPAEGEETPLKGIPADDSIEESEIPSEPSSGGALRQSCERCGYKNPRDVGACMKCGGPLKRTAPARLAQEAAAAVQALGLDPPTFKVPEAAPPAPAAGAATLPPGTLVEAPVTRTLVIAVSIFALGALAFVGYRLHKPARSHLLLEPKQPPAKTAAPVPSSPAPRRRRRSAARAWSSPVPGTRRASTAPAHVRSNSGALSPDDTAGAADSADSNPVPSSAQGAAASYGIVREATPLKRREDAPINSPYALKRRANRALWTEQQKQAIRQVQRFRLYGGQRTLQRNVEILMQILRDREYNTAFETGKRIYLYDDVDWDAMQTDGPAYQVRLTFSGGREADGTAREPLRFAFDTDLERGTVEPGGSDATRSNTLHAFFDESRIPPEDRRDIARDTEELVQAAQPDASPLAFDTVARHFAATYGIEATKRVAQAYGLSLLSKKILHEPRLAAPSAAAIDDVTPVAGDAQNQAPAPTSSVPDAVSSTVNADKGRVRPTKTILAPSKSGPVEYQMQPLGGRERSVTARASSSAAAARLFDVMTGYDRLKDFVPDLLVSEREGQDGSASIVHVVALTRFMVFVFKINLHLRIIEHPQEHSLEFERIAGEFEQFRGSVQIGQENSGGPTVLQLRASIVPKGHMPDWVLRAMAQRFLVPVIDALRVQAETAGK